MYHEYNVEKDTQIHDIEQFVKTLNSPASLELLNQKCDNIAFREVSCDIIHQRGDYSIFNFQK